MPNIITRRSFLGTGVRASMLAAVASLVNIPGFMKRALAEGTIGVNGKKVFFIFMRGGNDSINSVIPIEDPAYATSRPLIGIPKDPAVVYSDVTNAADNPGAGYPYAIRLGNGFAALHPGLSDLAPVFNAGQLGVIHRVAYPRQSRSHFDSERYWENGVPGNNKLKEGILYRTMVESGLIGDPNHTITGVSVQSNMPLILRGELPMTNLSDPNRYDLLGVYSAARTKHLDAIAQACAEPHPDKFNRDLVYSMGTQFLESLELFKTINFANNEFYDADGTTHLFPINAASDQKGLGSGAYGFFNNLKIAAQILAGTNAIVAGTQIGGFDTHTSQVTSGSSHLGAHANLMRRIGWAFYALRKFFMDAGIWNDVVVVTLSEFGRTTIENESMGTDHAEAAAMFVGGGSVNGRIYQCHPNDAIPWVTGPANQAGGIDGSMFGVSDRYLKRSIDFRSVLGEIVRDHLGATQDQLNRIIPGYANEAVEHLKDGIDASQSTTPITGELGIV
jgi:uncharacterized protein (DUF1501 family)